MKEEFDYKPEESSVLATYGTYLGGMQRKVKGDGKGEKSCS